MPTLPAKIRAARAGLGISQRTLADEAGINHNTVSSLEMGKDTLIETMQLCQEVFEARGVEFIEVSGRHGIILPDHLPNVQVAAMRAARAGLDMTRERLAAIAGLTMGTAQRIESGNPAVGTARIRDYLMALSSLGIVLFDVDGRMGVMLPPAAQLRRILSENPR